MDGEADTSLDLRVVSVVMDPEGEVNLDSEDIPLPIVLGMLRVALIQVEEEVKMLTGDEDDG